MSARPPFPVFVGCPRSGTTLVRAMFDSHPWLAVGPDSGHFIEFLRRGRAPADPGFLAQVLVGDRSYGGRITQAAVRSAFQGKPPASPPEAVRRFLALYAAGAGKERYGIKTPAFVYHLPMLGEAFPEARFVHIIRDGREVAASMLARERFTDDVAVAADKWTRAIQGARTAARDLGDRYFELRYEALVADPVAVLKQACAFLGLPYSDAMLDYRDRDLFAGRPPHYAVIQANLTKPPTSGLRNWASELSPENLTCFEVIAGPVLRSLGYELSGHPASATERMRARVRLASARMRQSAAGARSVVGRLTERS